MKQVGHYEVLSLLGEGGMASVYRGRDPRFGRDVAIKVLDAKLHRNPEIVDRFRSEAVIQAKLNHPNIVTVYDFIADETTLAIVMELIEGATLGAIVEQQNGPLPLERCLDLMTQILDAVGYAHSVGLVHRDIKPSNVMVRQVGRREVAKIMDFGIAKILGGEKVRTATGAKMGTLAYMSPEQVRSPRLVDHRSDIYSLGAVLYEMLTGAVPFDAESEYELMRQIVESKPAPLRTRSAAIPSQFEVVVARAMAKDPAARFQSTDELREALERAASGPPVAPDLRENVAEAKAATAAPPAGEERAAAARTAAPGVAAPVVARAAAGPPSSQRIDPRRSTRRLSGRAVGSIAVGVGVLLVIITASFSSRTGVNTLTPVQPEFVRIPEGTFTMGCTEGDSKCEFDEKPAHPVTISWPFELAKTETTNEQYRACVDAGRCSRPAPSGEYDDFSLSNHPVVNVSWHDAFAFCGWAGGRLPTEAEWEYAARGGSAGWKYPWGNSISHEQANYGKDECCGGLAKGRDRWVGTSPVQSFDANGYGLYDMAGNVWEWTADWYGPYSAASATDPRGASSGQYRVLRGGSWYVNPRYLRVSDRDDYDPTERNFSNGFRCARDVIP